MTKHTRALYLGLLLIGLVGVTYSLTGRLAIPSGDAAIWFHAGLLMLVISAYWIEHFFTKPADVLVNSLVVFIAVSSLSNPPLPVWWRFLQYASLLLMVGALVVIWSGSPALSRNDTTVWKRGLYGLVVRFGSANVLFSFVFVLSLISYFDVQRPESQLAVIFWGIALSLKHLNLDGFVAYLFRWRERDRRAILGHISRFAEPNIVRFDLFDHAECKRGALVAFSEAGTIDDSSPVAMVIGHRRTPDSIEAEAIVFGLQSGQSTPVINRFAVAVDADVDLIARRLDELGLHSKLDHMIGFASRGSDIARLYFEIVKQSQIEEGQLVSVPIASKKELLFQIINGKLHEEAALEGSERTFTIGEAEQLGTWNDDRQGFETHAWVVPENAPVFHVDDSAIVVNRSMSAILEVGRIPSSAFPVNISIRDLVLYHSAILGVTGSGKSFLAYQLIEECAATGIKVLCLDITGDYKRYLRDPVLIRRSGQVKEFFDSGNTIGIVEFSEEKTHPIQATNMIANMALTWCRENRAAEEVKEPVPKVLLVLEEAHSLVPEWNSNPEKNLQDVVSRTAQVTLQARKYGLGFMVITQRTANVTKSILNQCNTIFAFQAYDETGFDFMKNYMGDHYVQALPNLKKRQGVLVGKASVSNRPVIVRFQDQEREPSNEPPTDFAAPAVVAPANAEESGASPIAQ